MGLLFTVTTVTVILKPKLIMNAIFRKMPKIDNKAVKSFFVNIYLFEVICRTDIHEHVRQTLLR